jgi:CHASE3 domain sensor protein
MMLSSIASFVSIRSLLDNNDLVNHTQKVIYNLNEAAAQMLETQTSMQGFLVNSNENFLKDFEEAKRNTNAYFEKVEQVLFI